MRTAPTVLVGLFFFLLGPSSARAASPDCLAVAPDPSAAGIADPFHPAKLEATQANEKAAGLYKQLHWEEARTLYRQALSIDPLFLAPRLNVACSYVRQERFGEAADEAAALLHAAYVPWSREIIEAADLGALRNHPAFKRVEAASNDERARWAAGLETDALFFVGRLRAPVRIPKTGQGVFILGLKQEAFAFLPAHGVFRQLTATDGHVLAILPSRQRRWLAVVTGEKLVRAARGTTLRGVAVEIWDLATFRPTGRWRLPADVETLVLAERASGLHVAIRVAPGEQSRGENMTLRLAGDEQIPAAPLRPLEAAVVLDGSGARHGARLALEATTNGFCRWSLAPQSATNDKGPAILIKAKEKGRAAFSLASPAGVGVVGLPFDDFGSPP